MSLRKALLLIFSVAAFRCAAGSAVALTDRAARDGLAVSRVALASYDDFENVEEKLATRQKTLRLATGEISIEKALAGSGPHYGEELTGRRAAFEALASAYQALADLSGSTAPEDSGKAAARLAAAAVKIGNAPAWVLKNLPSAAATLTSLAQADSAARRNRGFAVLLTTYADLWEHDTPSLGHLVQEDLADYRRLVLTISPDRFEATRLGNTVRQPFVKEANVDLYKLDLVTSAEGEARAWRGGTTDVLDALRELAAVHEELGKGRPARDAVAAHLASIEQFLPEKPHKGVSP